MNPAVEPLSLEGRERAAVASPAAKLRVLHYMATNFGMTGVETFILQLVEAQHRAGLMPRLTLEVEGREEVRDRLAARGIPVHDFPTRGESRLPRKLATAGVRARRVRALVELLGDADVLHMHSVGVVGLDAFLAAKIARKPVVVTHHATLTWFSPMRTRLSDATFWLEKRIARFVVMPYEAAAEELVENGVPRDHVVVVPFCVDETRFSLNAERPARTGQFQFVMSSRMLEGKGHLELLAAFDEIRAQHPEARLLLLGDGPSRPAVEAEIDRRGLRAVVTVRGHTPHADMPGLLTAADAIVLPSYMSGETFPLSLLEGMALGLPAIGSRWFGIPDIVDDGVTGLVVPPKDVPSLVRAMRRMLTDGGFVQKASLAARKRVGDRFTASAVADEYSRLYRGALSS